MKIDFMNALFRGLRRTPATVVDRQSCKSAEPGKGSLRNIESGKFTPAKAMNEDCARIEKGADYRPEALQQSIKIENVKLLFTKQ